MATRRGANNTERFGTDLANSTASNTIVFSPSYVWAISVSKLSESSATGSCSIADSTASGDADKETAKIEFYLGAGGASGGSETRQTVVFQKPWFVQNDLVCSITGVSIAVQYSR